MPGLIIDKPKPKIGVQTGGPGGALPPKPREGTFASSGAENDARLRRLGLDPDAIRKKSINNNDYAGSTDDEIRVKEGLGPENFGIAKSPPLIAAPSTPPPPPTPAPGAPLPPPVTAKPPSSPSMEGIERAIGGGGSPTEEISLPSPGMAKPLGRRIPPMDSMSFAGLKRIY